MKHVAFFGDAERTFALTSALIVELERKTGTGIGTLCLRIPDGHFRHSELGEIIRLSLIGGGTPAEEAASLVSTYVNGQPLADSYKLASAILARVWAGESATEAQENPVNG